MIGPSERDFENFFDRKSDFDVPQVSSVKPLREFIDDFPNEELIPNLVAMEGDYKYYRAIAGDGNCFYRAIMFQYLKQA